MVVKHPREVVLPRLWWTCGKPIAVLLVGTQILEARVGLAIGALLAGSFAHKGSEIDLLRAFGRLPGDHSSGLLQVDSAIFLLRTVQALDHLATAHVRA